MKLFIATLLILLVVVMGACAMSADEFKRVGIGDTVFLDFTQYRMPSISGKVIDITKNKPTDATADYVVIYERRPDGSWSATMWHYYWITKIVEKAPASQAEMVAKIKQLEMEKAGLEKRLADILLLVNDFVAKLKAYYNIQ